MKKQLTLFAATALAAMTVVPTIGFADDSASKTSITYDSKGTVEFVAPTNSDTPNKPLDPTNPDPNKPLDPKNPDGKNPNPGTKGPITLDFASSFDFGKQEITSVDKTYNTSAQLLGDGKYVPDYAQITDNRGTFAGWTLSVKELDNFHTSTKVDLKATQINFKNLNHATTNTLKTDVSMPSAGFVIKPGADDTTPGASVNIMSGAKAADGKTNGTSGTHIIRFGNDDSLKTDDTQANGEKRANTVDPSVTLDVPGASDKMAKMYTTTLQWTLGETPTTID